MEEDSQATLGKIKCAELAIAFCNKIRAAGYQPMLYTNLNWATNYIDMARIDAAGIDVWFWHNITHSATTKAYILCGSIVEMDDLTVSP